MPESTAPTVPSLTPHLVCRGAAEAIDFYQRAFGAVEEIRVPGPDGKLMHACVTIQGAPVMLVDENLEMNGLSPLALKGTPVMLHLMVEDVDAAIARAEAAGARVVMPAEDMFWGDRYGQVEDPFGHLWSLATPQRQLSVEEIQAAARDALCGPGAAG